MIVTVTLNPAIDKSSAIDHVEPESKMRCDAPTREPGGGGINVSRAVRILGGKSVALWTGGGHTGHLMSDLLERDGIDHRKIPIKNATRESFVVFERSSGQQYRFGMPGPETSEKEAEQCIEMVRALKPGILVLSGSLPAGLGTHFYARIIRETAGDARVVLDTSGDALRQAVEEGPYLLKPNLRELGRLVDRKLEDDPQIEDAARELIGNGKAEVVVVSLGAGGAMLVTSNERKNLRSPTVPIQSKVGAGDSMVAGMVLTLERGRSIDEAARFGVAAGAAAVMTPGSELCRREDTERLYRGMAKEAGVSVAEDDLIHGG